MRQKRIILLGFYSCSDLFSRLPKSYRLLSSDFFIDIPATWAKFEMIQQNALRIPRKGSSFVKLVGAVESSIASSA